MTNTILSIKNSSLGINLIDPHFIVLPLQTIPLFEFLITSTLIFLIGIIGIIFSRKNLIILFMCIELTLLGISLTFIAFSIYLEDPRGQLYALLILTLAAAESAIGLAILVVYYRITKTISLDSLINLRG
jgi:NADH-quinone oxidoreductase subunit K